jgi:diacylglycerol kinase family enzyme
MAAGSRTAAIFLNAGAGSAGSSRIRRAVELARAALDADLHVISTRNANELAAWLAERAPRYQTAVIAGGDGSLSVAYNVLAGLDVTLGYIPAGFGNATAHLLGLQRRPEQLADVLRAGESRSIDLVDANGRLALFVGAGWDAVVADRYARDGARRMAGWAVAIARSTPDLLRRTSVRLETDGAVAFEGPIEMLIASTTPWYGRGLLVNPGARPDAGRLTLRAYPGPMPAFALEAVRWLAHRPPHAAPLVAKSATLRRLDGAPLLMQADGDVIGLRDEWNLGVRPAAVRLIGRW